MEIVRNIQLNGNINAMTVDVEDWFQVANLKGIIRYEDWEQCESRIELTIRRIVALFYKKNAKATFFTLGWIADRFPALIELIRDYGHEIATHGYTHRSVFELSKDEFRREIFLSVDKLAGISGEQVIGFRAPNYSIQPDTAWAWDILSEAGIKYDSSIFPVKHNRYGYSNAPRFPFYLDLNSHGKMIEFPLSTLRLMGNNIPVAGGAYLRLFPYWLIRTAIKRLNANNKPAIIYFHPWELDPGQPRVHTGYLTQLKHYGNLETTEAKLSKLLDEFKFTSVRDILGLGS